MDNADLSKLRIDKAKIAPIKPGKKYLYGAIVMMVVALGIFLYARGIIIPAIDVEVVNVTLTFPSQAITLLNASGYVVAQRKASVASKATGRLVSLSVEEGSRVKEGEVIAQLENADAIATKEQADANLNVARYGLDQAVAELDDAAISFNRQKDLLSKGVVSRASYDTVQARYNKAKAAVAAAEAQIKAGAAALRSAKVALEYTFIRAPFDAVVLTKNADIGDIVTPLGAAANAKAAVVTIADMDSLQVETDVSESNIYQVKIGQPCEIQLDAIHDSRFRGEVHMIVPTADRSKATIMVKVRFLDKDQRILPEMSAKVAFLSRNVRDDEQTPRVTLNPAAIIKSNSGHEVFLVRGDKVVKTQVKAGVMIGDMIEILSGVGPGDRLVIKPLNRMKDGVRVKVAEE
ncbi:MAG: efflux RND transporter periplasmic adaptor subunit [Nitrospirae bacterium]|nr:efflux RND transporter periplasmic adaptor subunit [Nitrospirota bacterium]